MDFEPAQCLKPNVVPFPVVTAGPREPTALGLGYEDEMPVGQSQQTAVRVAEICFVGGYFDQLFGGPVGEAEEQIPALLFVADVMTGMRPLYHAQE